MDSITAESLREAEPLKKYISPSPVTTSSGGEDKGREVDKKFLAL